MNTIIMNPGGRGTFKILAAEREEKDRGGELT